MTELRGLTRDRVFEADMELLVSIDFDPTRIGQLASNLIGNAITHGAPGQPVRVHAEVAGEALVTCPPD